MLGGRLLKCGWGSIRGGLGARVAFVGLGVGLSEGSKVGRDVGAEEGREEGYDEG